MNISITEREILIQSQKVRVEQEQLERMEKSYASWKLPLLIICGFLICFLAGGAMALSLEQHANMLFLTWWLLVSYSILFATTMILIGLAVLHWRIRRQSQKLADREYLLDQLWKHSQVSARVWSDITNAAA